MMLQDLSHSSFEEQLNTSFCIDAGEETPLEVVLYLVRLHEPHGGPRPQPFSLYFRGPRQPVLPQAIYRMEHDRMGTMDIFLVPIGPDGQGMGYEAVFN
jgi:hypothetical protein